MQFVFFYTTVIASLPQGWILYKKKASHEIVEYDNIFELLE